MIKAGYGSIMNLLTCAAITPILPQGPAPKWSARSG